MAPERAGDVHSRRAEPAPSSDGAGPCPFCPGQEHLNPAEIATTSADDGWEIRVTPTSVRSSGSRATPSDAAPGCST
jgi:hypothetical protein